MGYPCNLVGKYTSQLHFVLYRLRLTHKGMASKVLAFPLDDSLELYEKKINITI